MYLVDGAQNHNRMDGGYALKLPVEAIAEFRILAQTAPAEYGGTAGATTSVVTRSGTNQFHGTAYEFVRNDAFDARNFFSAARGAAQAAPVRRHGRRPGRAGSGPVLRLLRGLSQHAGPDDDRDRTNGAGAAGRLLAARRAAAEFRGRRRAVSGQQDSGRGDQPGLAQRRRLFTRWATCRRRSTGRRSSCTTPRTRRAAGSTSTSRRQTRLFARYSYSGGNNINPVSVRGTDVPGFPTRDDYSTHQATLSNTRILSPSLTNSLRGAFLRHAFFFDQRLNRTPPAALGFGYDSSSEVGQGPPFFNISGYSPIGGAITGPRNSTQQLVRDPGQPGVVERLAPGEGRWRVPADRHRHGADDRAQCVLRLRRHVPDQQRGRQPAARRAGHVLPGARQLRTRRDVWSASAFAQDEWRVTPRVTLNYGLRYERITPFTEAEDRLNGFVPGRAVGRQAGRAGGPALPRRSGHRARHREGRACVDAARRAGVGSDRFGRLVDPGGATVPSTTSSRMAPERRRKLRSAARRGRSSSSSAVPA